MYLRGSKWNMAKPRRRRSTPWRIIMLLTLIAATLYCNIYVVPEIPIFSQPTSTPTKNPESFVKEAETLFKEGKLLQAIDAYEQAIQSDPLEKSNYVSMARVQAFAGQYEEAEKSAKMSLIENDNYALGHAVLGWTYNFLEDYLHLIWWQLFATLA